MTRFTKILTSTAALAILAALAAATPSALACGAPARKEIVTGVFPRVSMTYAPWEMMTLDDTTHDGKLERHRESFRVAFDARLSRFERFEAADLAQMEQVGVTLERTRGSDDDVWHLVRVEPIAATRAGGAR